MQPKKSSVVRTPDDRLSTPVEVRLADMMLPSSINLDSATCPSVFVRVRPAVAGFISCSDFTCLSVFVRVRPVRKIRHIVDSETSEESKNTTNCSRI